MALPDSGRGITGWWDAHGATRGDLDPEFGLGRRDALRVPHLQVLPAVESEPQTITRPLSINKSVDVLDTAAEDVTEGTE